MPTANNAGPSPWIKGAAWIFGIFLPLLGSGLFTIYTIQRDADNGRHRDIAEHVEKLGGLVSGLLTAMARVNEHTDSHDDEAGYWKTRIEGNAVSIQDLETGAHASPAPFAGAQGRELERRIDHLERCPTEIEWLRERIKDLSEQMNETENYYRRGVLPLLQQSNSLQQQNGGGNK